MSELFPLPPGYVIRPARAGDRWQLHRLLRNFGREASASGLAPSSAQRVTLYLLSGLLLTLIIHTIVLIGPKLLLYFGAIASLVLAMLWLSLHLSKDWQRFWVVEGNGQLVACAKLCRYGHYSLLFNVLVAPEHRQRGLGSALVQHMIQHAVKPLYLACLPDKIEFYKRFGFVSIPSRELSPSLRYDLGLSIRLDIVPLVLQPTGADR
jgi:N-acetylglutamate synthase-like GNAT family acetyltransferase